MGASKLYLPQMLMIGSAGRNSGKTTLAVSFIRHWAALYPVYALKIVTITGAKGICQRGGKGCGICTDIREDYELVEEINADSQKDTGLMLAAGARRSYLLKSVKDALPEAIAYFLRQVPQEAIIVCETNSGREFIRPGAFLFVDNQKEKRRKPTAERVWRMADMIIKTPDTISTKMLWLDDHAGSAISVHPFTKEKAKEQCLLTSIG